VLSFDKLVGYIKGRVRVDKGGNVTPKGIIRETENRVDSEKTYI
jgi:hypothetical protein